MESVIKNKVGFKKTKIGLIPIGWELKKLFEVCTLLNGKAYKQIELLDKGKYKVLRVGNFFTKGSWYYSDLELEDKKYVNKGDLMYAWSASFGPKFWQGDKTIYHYHIWKVEPNNLIDKFFLYHYFVFDKYKLLQSKQGGTMFHVTKGDMEKRILVLPTLKEQQKIAQILSTWDEAIETTQKLIEQLQLRKKGLMQELLSGKKRLNGFTEEWKEIKLGDITNRITKKNTELNDTVITISAQRGFVKQEDFFKKRVASRTLSGYYLIEKGHFAYNKSYSNGYPMGAFKRLDTLEKAVVTTLYICFEAKSNVDSDFLLNYFEGGMITKSLTKIAQEGGRAHGLLNIGINDFFALKLIVPSLDEQKGISKVLNAVDEELNSKLDYLKSLKQQKKGLMQQLLTGKKRIKI